MLNDKFNIFGELSPSLFFSLTKIQKMNKHISTHKYKEREANIYLILYQKFL